MAHTLAWRQLRDYAPPMKPEGFDGARLLPLFVSRKTYHCSNTDLFESVDQCDQRLSSLTPAQIT